MSFGRNEIKSTGNQAITGTDFHISNSAKFEPRRVNNFELIIDFGSTIDGKPINNKYSKMNAENTTNGPDGFSVDYMMKSVMLSVKNFDAPKINVDPQEVHYGNNSLKYAGKPKFSNTNLTVYDYIGLDVEGVMNAWFRQTYDIATEQVGLAKDYKKNGMLKMYAPNGTCCKVWQMRGLWISSLDFGTFDQSGGLRELKCTIEYDRAYPWSYNSAESTEDDTWNNTSDKTRRY